MRIQALLLGQDEPRRGEDRHDSAAALPADRWTPGIRGGGPVPRSRGEIRGRMKIVGSRPAFSVGDYHDK